MRGIRAKSRRAVKFASQFERLEGRQLFSVLTVGPTSTFHTIQTAVNASVSGDTILVTPGTYTEQVTIPSTKTNLLIEAQNPQSSPSSVSVPAGSSVAQVNALFPASANPSIIAAPASMTSPKAVVTDNANGVRITGFVIQGPGGGPADSLEFGVLVNNATNVEIDHNHIVHIHDAPTSGNQTGVAVEVENGGTAHIHDDFISDYQKDGIVITGSNSIGTVDHNVVVGDGPTAVINQNGIVFDSAGSGSASNNLVTGNVYTPQTTEDGGILLFNSGQVSILNNTVYNNDGDIIVDGPSRSPNANPNNLSDYANGSTVSGNETYGATYDGISLFDSANSVTISSNNSHNNSDDGLRIDNTSFGNQIDNNTFIQNNTAGNGSFDIEDLTYGQSNPVQGTFGTANFYSGNTFATSNFPVPVTGDTIFSPTSAPAANNQNISDPNITAAGGVDLGTKFRSDVPGVVTAVRFFKGAQETGTQTGQLWSSTGTLLASVTFTAETASGWQQMNFSSPVTIAANTTYIISYNTTSSTIAYTAGGLSSGVDNPPLHALASGVSGGNGVYHYDTTPGAAIFPSVYNGQSPNYWVDLVFNPSAPAGTTIFSPTSAPASGFQNVSDPNITSHGGVDLGTKFTSDVAGSVTGVRFFKGMQDNGSETGQLWTSAGALLASVSFTNETASGWQQANFSTPVSISANTTYIISYNTTSPTIAYTPGGLSSGVNNPPLHALPSSVAGGDGVYNYDTTPGTAIFPTTYNGQSPNYWVDVVFNPSTVTPDTIFSPNSAPASGDQNVNDPNITSHGGVDLGIKFTSDVAGSITAVRFFKGLMDTGVHIGDLWSSTGTLLATATFTGETASGWQQVNFSNPVAITANTVYIVSYHTTAANIAYTAGGLATGIDNGPLHALPSSTPGGDGVYQYDVTPGTPAFPSTYNGQSPNYWVDVVFTPS